ncbi:helix-turn-helix domain-containing protein [Thermodesulfobacterium hydrogeniphilum]|uniref:helix-turn-helix domain-containing protein n=1 Tax=Thermodesulfobacterium hydrogeniphilum TaxID=161156 RepID=UPI00056E48B2|nr:helix-turn-helix domain-containing protein [Thermodesulfobacterium hydrogeniphilum]
MFLTVPVVARLLGVAERTLRYWCEAGKVPAMQVAVKKVQDRKRKGRWYIHWSWVEEKLKERGLLEEKGEELLKGKVGDLPSVIIFQKVVYDLFRLNLIDQSPEQRLKLLLDYYKKHPEENPLSWTNLPPIAAITNTEAILKSFVKLPKKALLNDFKFPWGVKS